MAPGHANVTRMFPLGAVLLPGQILPMHIFEPRFRTLLADALADDDTFGVVLIRRGSEVGGGEERHDIGTLARIVRVENPADDDLRVICRGIERIRVLRWLADDPYPRAVTERWPEELSTDRAPDAVELVTARVIARLREVADYAVRLARESGVPAPPTESTAEIRGALTAVPPEHRVYALTRWAPLGAADNHRILSAPGTAEQLAALDAALDDVIEAARFRIRYGT